LIFLNFRTVFGSELAGKMTRINPLAKGVKQSEPYPTFLLASGVPHFLFRIQHTS